MAARKPTNMLKLSKKPSLKKSPVLAESERLLKEKKQAERAASKSGKKPAAKKTPVKKAAAKKPPAKKRNAPSGAQDPMWKNLVKALKKEKSL